MLTSLWLLVLLFPSILILILSGSSFLPPSLPQATVRGVAELDMT